MIPVWDREQPKLFLTSIVLEEVNKFSGVNSSRIVVPRENPRTCSLGKESREISNLGICKCGVDY